MNNNKNDYFVHQSSEIDKKVLIGTGTKIWHFSHVLSNTRIGKNVTVGQGCMLGPNVSVGDYTKLQNNVSLFDGLIVEENVFFGPSCVVTNVKNPRSAVDRKDRFEKTIIREGATIGANSTILCGVEIGRNAFIAAGAVLTKSVPQNSLFAGVPAKQVGWVSDIGEVLDKDLYCKHEKQQYFLDKKGVLRKKLDTKICILTYDRPHVKTQMLADELSSRGYKLDFCISKFIQNKPREVLFNHRPNMFNDITHKDLAKKYDSDLFDADQWQDRESDYKYMLIGGANLLKDKSFFTGKVINSHAGLIPNSRGLDSFKWSIINKKKMGVTLHFIDAETDMGTIIKQKETMLLKTDTIQEFASRHYFNEINVMYDFEFHLENKNSFASSTEEPTKRMPKNIEDELFSEFEVYKDIYAI